VIKAGYKQTEVGVIPEDWEVSILGDVCSKITDGTHDTPKPIDRGVPFLTAIHVKENKIDFNGCYYLSQKVHDEIYKRCNPEINDVLMVNIGAGVATAALVSVDYEFSLKNVALLKPKNSKLSGSYLNYYQSLAKRKITESISTGGAQPFLSLWQIAQLKIALPPTKSEQITIAKALSDTDALIQSLSQLIAKKRQIKQGAMQSLLNPYDETGALKVGWVFRKLGDLAEFINGRAYNISEWEQNGTPVIRLQNLTGRGSEYYYSNLQLPKKQYCENGDLLYMWSATFGAVIWWGDKAIYHYHIWKIGCMKGIVDKVFLFYILDNLTEKLKKSSSSGGTMLHITKDKMENTELMVPAYEEQTQIAKILTDMDTEITALETKLSKYQTIKQGMMQNLLTGRIRLVSA